MPQSRLRNIGRKRSQEKSPGATRFVPFVPSSFGNEPASRCTRPPRRTDVRVDRVARLYPPRSPRKRGGNGRKKQEGQISEGNVDKVTSSRGSLRCRRRSRWLPSLMRGGAEAFSAAGSPSRIRPSMMCIFWHEKQEAANKAEISPFLSLNSGRLDEENKSSNRDDVRRQVPGWGGGILCEMNVRLFACEIIACWM